MIKRMISLLALLSFVFAPFTDKALSQPNDLSDATVYTNIGRFFTAVLHAPDPIAHAIDKERFSQEINSLGNLFEQMITEKRTIAAALKDQPNKALYTANKLEGHVVSAVDRLNNISFLLKQNYRDEGAEVAYQLQKTFLFRKSWMRQILQFGVSGASTERLETWSREATESADELDKANTELAKLIAKTNKP
jgi:hypothetical protein